MLLAARSSWRGSPALAALGCTGLTILGWVCALPGSLVWMEVTNRSLGLGALWITVHLAHRRQGKEEALAHRRTRQTPDVAHAHESLQAGMAAANAPRQAYSSNGIGSMWRSKPRGGGDHDRCTPDGHILQ